MFIFFLSVPAVGHSSETEGRGHVIFSLMGRNACKRECAILCRVTCSHFLLFQSQIIRP